MQELGGETIFSNLNATSALLEAHHTYYRDGVASLVQNLQDGLEQELAAQPQKPHQPNASFFSSNFSSTFEQTASPFMPSYMRETSQPSSFLSHAFFVLEMSTAEELDTEEDTMHEKLLYFHPAKVERNHQLQFIGIIQGLLNQSQQFDYPPNSVSVIEFEKSKVAIYYLDELMIVCKQ